MRKKRVLNPLKQRLRLITLFVFGYVFSAVLLYDLYHAALPLLARELITLYTLPLRHMFRPLYPLLHPLGLVVSQGAELPSPYGIVAGSVLYIGILLLLTQLFTERPEKYHARTMKYRRNTALPEP
jgi:hypothetical protein